jgi:tetratricopeptide (TPR) repeat protein
MICFLGGDSCSGNTLQNGRVCESSGRLAEAADAYQRSTDHFEKMIRYSSHGLWESAGPVEAYGRLGGVLQKQGEVGQAEKAHRRAEEILQQNPRFRQSHASRKALAKLRESRGDLLAILDRYQEAEQSYRQALNLYEEDARAATTVEQRRDSQVQLAAGWGRLAEFQRRHGRFESAEDARRRALALCDELFKSSPEKKGLRSSLARAHSQLAWLLAIRPDRRSHHAVEALKHAKKAVEVEPDYHDWWHTLGVAHCRTGQWKEALAAIEKSRRLQGGSDPPSSFDRFQEKPIVSPLSG